MNDYVRQGRLKSGVITHFTVGENLRPGRFILVSPITRVRRCVLIKGFVYRTPFTDT